MLSLPNAVAETELNRVEAKQQSPTAATSFVFGAVLPFLPPVPVCDLPPSLGAGPCFLSESILYSEQ